jgi:hypothetical protein
MTPADRPALLMVSMEPPAALEDEFNDWYDTEHVPQRLALPGFVSGSRWVCIDGWPRWMALYDLASDAAVQSDAYLRVSGAQSTPWSRRILPRTVGKSRVTAVALEGEPHDTQLEPRRTSRLLVMGVPLPAGGAAPRSIVAAVRDALSVRDGVLQQRAFLDRTGLRPAPPAEPSGPHPPRLASLVEASATLWLFAAFDAPVTAGSLAVDLGRPCGLGATTFNLYVPYRRGSP